MGYAAKLGGKSGGGGCKSGIMHNIAYNTTFDIDTGLSNVDFFWTGSDNKDSDGWLFFNIYCKGFSTYIHPERNTTFDTFNARGYKTAANYSNKTIALSQWILLI